MSDLKLMTISIFRFAERVVRNFFDHRMATYAAALAYRGLFALFPFMLIFVVLLGVFGPPDAFGRLVDEIKVQSSEQAPQQLEPVVEQGRGQIQPLEGMARRAQRQADGELLNTVYGLTEIRLWWKTRVLSLASGPILAFAVIVAIVFMLTGSWVIESAAEILGL